MSFIHLDVDEDMAFLQVAYKGRAVVARGLSFSRASDRRPIVTALESNFGSILSSDGTSLLYSPNGGKTVSHVAIQGLVENSTASFKQILSNRFGEFVAVTEAGDMIYGREGLTTLAAKLTHNLSPTAVIAFPDKEGYLYILEPQTIGDGTVSFRTMQLSLVHSIGDVNDASCTSQAMLTDAKDEYNLDREESILIATSVVSSAWESVNLAMSISHPALLAVTSTPVTTSDEAPEITVGLLTANLVEKVESAAATGDTYGVSHVRFNTVPNSLRCSHSTQRVSHVTVGCPPLKHVRVRNAARKCGSLETGYRYEIAPHRYDPSFRQGAVTPNESLLVDYAFDTLGCPVMSHYKDVFQPEIDVYVGDKFVGPMLDEFVMYEVHGMYDYRYNTTVTQAGCLRASQTWLDVLQTEVDPGVAWTRRTHRSCFYAETGSLPQPDTKYEVLGGATAHASRNGIFWPKENGIYVFEAIGIDERYTFCNYRVRFAVQVYGMSHQAVVPDFTVSLSFMLVSTVCIIVSYFIILHNRQTAAKKQEEIKAMYQNHELDDLSLDYTTVAGSF
ncbi:PREDICTED: cation channel sperm-associated protein subunit delta-like isoform X2 [Priapulus caudatus]|uniref:Cation channel sperm-associated protein subunit delta-like isoform X2 n=1 Tax=Priapulus caudatus TaxID=37621 RepID=A0ABM1ENV9_PRICU|nr:PREDICTED: cation channel sperm-associated protein subunit delta-like isoform X2 [Priapulus caudatus]